MRFRLALQTKTRQNSKLRPQIMFNYTRLSTEKIQSKYKQARSSIYLKCQKKESAKLARYTGRTV